MAEEIIDGTGKGYQAKVDKFNRVHTLSVSESISEAGGRLGNSFNVNSGTINLTSANESCLLYLKNNGDDTISITTIGYLLGNSTGGAGDLECKIIKNPSTGTLISNAVEAEIVQNKNFGSSKSLDAIVYKGAEGNTITNGTNVYKSLLSGASRFYSIATGSIFVPKGASIAVCITPQTGNTNMDVQIFFSIVTDNLTI